MKKKMNDYENIEKGMIYMKILKKRGSREKGGGGNEIHAPCACGKNRRRIRYNVHVDFSDVHVDLICNRNDILFLI